MDKHKILEQVDHFEERRAKYEPVLEGLSQLYPPLVWRKEGSTLDILLLTILSASTTDQNSGQAFRNLQQRYPSYEAMLDAPLPELVETVRVAGLANQKAPRIQRALQRVLEERGAFDLEFLGELPSEEARAWLTSIDGIGLKTASIVISFGFNGAAFPVDTHINRVCQRIGFTPEGTTPEKAHTIMEAMIPPHDYFSFHVQVIEHGRKVCHARKPQCSQCPIIDWCDYYQNGATSKPDA